MQNRKAVCYKESSRKTKTLAFSHHFSAANQWFSLRWHRRPGPSLNLLSGNFLVTFHFLPSICLPRKLRKYLSSCLCVLGLDISWEKHNPQFLFSNYVVYIASAKLLWLLFSWQFSLLHQKSSQNFTEKIQSLTFNNFEVYMYLDNHVWNFTEDI